MGIGRVHKEAKICLLPGTGDFLLASAQNHRLLSWPKNTDMKKFIQSHGLLFELWCTQMQMNTFECTFSVMKANEITTLSTADKVQLSDDIDVYTILPSDLQPFNISTHSTLTAQNKLMTTSGQHTSTHISTGMLQSYTYLVSKAIPPWPGWKTYASDRYRHLLESWTAPSWCFRTSSRITHQPITSQCNTDIHSKLL